MVELFCAALSGGPFAYTTYENGKQSGKHLWFEWPIAYTRYKNLIGTVSAKIAPRLKCYKNASRLNRYNFPTDSAIDFLFSTCHTTPFHYEVLKIGSR